MFTTGIIYRLICFLSQVIPEYNRMLSVKIFNLRSRILIYLFNKLYFLIYISCNNIPYSYSFARVHALTAPNSFTKTLKFWTIRNFTIKLPN